MAFSSLLSNTTTLKVLIDIPIDLKGAAMDDVAVLGLVLLGGAGYLLKGIAWDKPDPYHHIWFQKPQELESNGQKIKKETRNIAEKLEESGKDTVIFWGSQSGTAEGFANRLARECHLRFGLSTMTADLSDYDAETIALIPSTKLAIFIMSTYGEGDPSDNAGGLWDWLKSSSDIKLPDLRYSAFGLGNRNYKYYNRVIDVVSGALDKFGATPLLPVGRADDSNGGTEEDFMDWKATLFSVFRNSLNYEEREITYEPTLSVILGGEPTADMHLGDPVQNTQKGSSAIYSLPLKNTRELFTSSTRNCLHIDIDLSSHPELKYRTGDHLAVWPTNPLTEVQRLLEVLNLTSSASQPIAITPLDPTQKSKIPTPTTLEILFTNYLEICAPISRDTITALTPFAPTPSAKLFLTHLGSSKSVYADFLSRTHVTLGRILEIALTTCTPGAQAEPCPTSWANLPLSFILEVLPPLSPRYYSISSSPLLSPRAASITAVVSQTPLLSNPTETIPGLATNYLLSHHNSGTPASVHAHIRTSKFRPPFSPATPLLLVAAGTGLAPFLAFLTERARLKAMGKPAGRVVLFFGCRNPGEDFIYRDELTALEAQLDLTIVTAFSRVQGQAKVYVQDRVREQADTIFNILTGDEGCGFYICGAAAMAREVGKVVGAVVGERKGWGEAEVKAWAEGMKRGRRWAEDVWG